MDVHVDRNDRSAEASVGDSVIIALPENGATGYQWSVHPDGDEVVVESSEFAPPESAAPGAAGQRVIRLRASRAGKAVVELRLQRPWETVVSEHRELAITVRG